MAIASPRGKLRGPDSSWISAVNVAKNESVISTAEASVRRVKFSRRTKYVVSASTVSTKASTAVYQQVSRRRTELNIFVARLLSPQNVPDVFRQKEARTTL